MRAAIDLRTAFCLVTFLFSLFPLSPFFFHRRRSLSSIQLAGDSPTVARNNFLLTHPRNRQCHEPLTTVSLSGRSHEDTPRPPQLRSYPPTCPCRSDLPPRSCRPDVHVVKSAPFCSVSIPRPRTSTRTPGGLDCSSFNTFLPLRRRLFTSAFVFSRISCFQYHDYSYLMLHRRVISTVARRPGPAAISSSWTPMPCSTRLLTAFSLIQRRINCLHHVFPLYPLQAFDAVRILRVVCLWHRFTCSPLSHWTARYDERTSPSRSSRHAIPSACFYVYLSGDRQFIACLLLVFSQ